MTEPDPLAADPAREAAFVQFWGHVGPWIAGGHADPEDVAHEAYCAGWDASPVRQPMRSPRGGRQSSRPQKRHRWRT